MKKYILLSLILLSPSMVGAYDCTTIATRMTELSYRLASFGNQVDIASIKSNNVTSYEEGLSILNELNALDTLNTQLETERRNLINEYNWCQNKKTELSKYASAGDSAYNELNSKDTYDLDLINKALTNYEKARSIMKEMSSNSDLTEINDRINRLTGYKNYAETRKTVYNKAQQAYQYAINGEEEKALQLYNEVLSYKNKLPSYDYTAAETNVIKLKNAIETKEKAKIQQENEEKKALENDIETAKNELGTKAAIFESLVPLFKAKDKDTQDNVRALLKTFTQSKDRYTRNIGIYFGYLVQE